MHSGSSTTGVSGLARPAPAIAAPESILRLAEWHNCCNACDWVPEQESGMPNKQEIKGRAQQIKGRVKETVGRVTNDPRQEAEGRDDQVAGAAKETVGTVRRNVKEAVEGVKRGLRATEGAVRPRR
jgi:uncharacterized protein YjbJ (UPF0337 family)